jgi:hypothetical protein
MTCTQRQRRSGLLGAGDARHSGSSGNRQTCDGSSQNDSFHGVPPLVTLREETTIGSPRFRKLRKRAAKDN